MDKKHKKMFYRVFYNIYIITELVVLEYAMLVIIKNIQDSFRIYKIVFFVILLILFIKHTKKIK